ncbi:MAG: hypothetical protein LBP91_00560 [Coriobacteriales bacterium]|nr:hypothetical protein [Coriobacteriales bacterium]
MKNLLHKGLLFIVVVILSLGAVGQIAGCAASNSTDDAQANTQQAANDNDNNANNDNNATNSEETNILVKRNCMKCHDISPLGLKGNGTGPDLAGAYTEVNKRFGLTLEEFMDKPEGTMSVILGNSPLSDTEKQEVIEILKGYNS